MDFGGIEGKTRANMPRDLVHVRHTTLDTAVLAAAVLRTTSIAL